MGGGLGSLLVGVDELTRSLRSSRSGLSIVLLVLSLLLLGGSSSLLRRFDGRLGDGRSMGRNDVVMEGVLDVFGLVGSSVESLKRKRKEDASKSARVRRLRFFLSTSTSKPSSEEKKETHLEVGIVLSEQELRVNTGSIDEHDSSIGRSSRSWRGRAVEMSPSERLVIDLDSSLGGLGHLGSNGFVFRP